MYLEKSCGRRFVWNFFLNKVPFAREAFTNQPTHQPVATEKREMARKLLCFAFAFLWAIPALGQKSVPAWPANLDTVRYPIFHKVEVMSAVKMADMGLHPVRLNKPIVVWNWTESRKRFLPDTLQAGVIVAADSAEQPVYKADCTNRLAPFPLGASVLSTERIDSTASRLLAGDSEKKGFWAGLGDLLGDATRMIGGFLLGLLEFLGGFLLLFLLLVLAFATALALAGLVRELWSRRSGATPPAPTPAPVPTPTPTARPFVTTPPSGATGGAASPLVAPTPPSGGRRFISYYPGEDHRIRFSGLRDVRFEEEEGVTTLRFRNA